MTFASNKSIYWVSASFIETLKITNFVPYLKNKPKNQTGQVGEPFSFSIPDSTFIDDDGNSTLTYYVTSRLPSGLDFDSDTRTIYGTPAETGQTNVNLTAIDAAEVSAVTSFSITINKASGIDQEQLEQAVQIFPNPARDEINLSLGTVDYKRAMVSVTDLVGKEIYSSIIINRAMAAINLPGNPAGIYFLHLNIDGLIINKKVFLE